VTLHTDCSERAGSAPADGVAALVQRLGLAPADAHVRFHSLPGGVASDIWKVEAGTQTFVLKRALSKLRVAQEWNVPVARSAAEVAWLRLVHALIPAAVPKVFASDSNVGAFAMEFLDPKVYPVWKGELAAGRADRKFAAAVGKTIGAIHAATARSESVAMEFANPGLFHSIRLDPYLEATARVHPELANSLIALSHETLAMKLALVHGDVSPKNILVGPLGPIFLDAECAWFGDPAFDLAFCLNHLLLKCLWVPSASESYLRCFDALATAYMNEVTWESPEELERRAARFLPALLLARVDGKSPVEYVTEAQDKTRVRRVSIPLIASPPRHLNEISTAWAKEIA
jgi:5-methylthioribose kinase